MVEVGVVVLPAAAPASPAPTVVVAAEVVAAVAAPLAVLEVDATDAPHPSVVTVALQQVGAINKEVGMGNAVILKDDAFLHLLEKPADRTAHPQATALVHIGIEPLDLAGPINLLLDHRAGGGHLIGFVRALGVWAVAGHKQAGGGYGPDCVYHLAQGVRSSPGN